MKGFCRCISISDGVDSNDDDDDFYTKGDATV